MTPFATALLAARARAGLSRYAVEDRAGIQRNTLVRYENGARPRRPQVVAALAGALGLDQRRLLALAYPQSEVGDECDRCARGCRDDCAALCALGLPVLCEAPDEAEAVLIARLGLGEMWKGESDV